MSSFNYIHPSTCIWYNQLSKVFIVTSLSYNREFGTRTEAGHEKVFSFEEMATIGWEYVKNDLNTFSNRLPAPRPSDPTVAISNAKKRYQTYRNIDVSLSDTGGQTELIFYPMNSTPGKASAVGGSDPVVIQFPVSQAMFFEALTEAINRVNFP